MNPVVLAYIGDGVHTLYVREKLAFSSTAKSGELNKREAKIVCANAQAKAVNALMEEFSDEELAIFKRARNSKKAARLKIPRRAITSSPRDSRRLSDIYISPGKRKG